MNEMRIVSESTLEFVYVFNSDGKVFDGSVAPYHATNSWVTWDDANREDYAILMSGKGGNVHMADFPVTITTPGRYTYVCRDSSIYPPTSLECPIDGFGEILWNGSASEDLMISRLLALVEGDAVIDKTATPWQLVITDKDTQVELLRKDLKDVDGLDISNTTTVVGQQIEP